MKELEAKPEEGRSAVDKTQGHEAVELANRQLWILGAETHTRYKPRVEEMALQLYKKRLN